MPDPNGHVGLRAQNYAENLAWEAGRVAARPYLTRSERYGIAQRYADTLRRNRDVPGAFDWQAVVLAHMDGSKS